MLLAALFAGGAAFALTPLAIALARRAGALDRPGPGKVHAGPVPSLGGLAPAAAALGALLLLQLAGHGIQPRALRGLVLASLLILAVGVLDDLRPRPALARLAAHFAAGGVLYAHGLGVPLVTNPFGPTIELGGPLGAAVTLLWVATVVNALNLIDGLDGLACGVGALAALSLAAVGSLAGERDVAALGLVLAGALLGFLPHNFPRARVFLGDCGSTFIGLALATLGLLENRKASTALTLLIPLVALALPVLDTVLAVARRTANGRSPARRDLGHLHHRLLRLGLTPPRAVGLLLAVTAAFGIAAVLMARLPKQTALSVTLVLAGLVAAALAALGRAESRNGSAAPRPVATVAEARTGSSGAR